MNKLRNLGILILWFVIGVALTEAEFLLWGVVNKYYALDGSFFDKYTNPAIYDNKLS